MSKTLYIAFGAMWDKTLLDMNYNRVFPLCINCKLLLKGNYNFLLSLPFVCPKCKKVFMFDEYKQSYITNLQYDVYQLYQASLRQDYDVITLDTPPAKVKAKDEDEHYVLWANMTQSKGKRLGLVYMAEKGDKDKVQIFIDLDSQQVRHDPANKPPKELLAKVTVEFNDGTKITQEYKKDEKETKEQAISIK